MGEGTKESSRVHVGLSLLQGAFLSGLLGALISATLIGLWHLVHSSIQVVAKTTHITHETKAIASDRL